MMEARGHRRLGLVGALLLYAMATPPAFADSDAGPSFTAQEERMILQLSPLDPKRLRDPTNRWDGDARAARFGEQLFFDTRLSGDGAGTCATCHIPSRGWAGGDLAALRDAPERRTPTLTNVAYNRWFNWDGSADSLWAQCLGPIESPGELNGSRVQIARRIQTDADLRHAYVGLFGPVPADIAPDRLPAAGRPMPDHPDHLLHRQWLTLSTAQRRAVDALFVNLGKAIAAFESTIVSDGSPFDRFAAGMRSGDAGIPAELPVSAQRGLKLFLGKGRCVLCHSGPNFSDGEFHNVFAGPPKGADLGRWDGVVRVRASDFNAESHHSDAGPGESFPWVHYVRRTVESKYQFKTPTLRNVALRAPYMHNGRLKTLVEVIDHYDDISRSRGSRDHAEAILTSLDLSPREKQDLIAFLHSLSDERMRPPPRLASAQR